LLSVFLAILSDAPTLSCGQCCEANRLLSGARFVVFGGDLFIDIECEQNDASIQIMNSVGGFQMMQRIVQNIESGSDLRRNGGL
jgi:hypothetical protein